MDRLDKLRDEAMRKAAVPFDAAIELHKQRLRRLLNQATESHRQEEPPPAKDGRSRKPKKKWKQVALYIHEHPSTGYPELCLHMYGEVNEQKLRNLRGLLFQLRAVDAITGEAGSWKLLKTPDEIEWIETTVDDIRKRHVIAATGEEADVGDDSPEE